MQQWETDGGMGCHRLAGLMQRGAAAALSSMDRMPSLTVAVPGSEGNTGAIERWAAVHGECYPRVKTETSLDVHIRASLHLVSVFEADIVTALPTQTNNRKDILWNSPCK